MKHALIFTALLLAPRAALTVVPVKAETHTTANLLIESHISEVAPGIYRIRAGEPEEIVPSLVRAPANTDALAAMPTIAAPPLRVSAIKVWRMARGCRIELPLDSGEVIYGLGLQCKHLEQNGWQRTLYTAPGDNNGGGMSHAPVPFYVSTAGYGVLVDSARCVTFSVGEKQRLADVSALAAEGGKQKNITDVAALYGPEKRDQTSVYVDVPAAGGVDVYLFAGPRMGEAVARYNLFSGGGCLPSLSGLGPEYLIGTMLDSKTALETCAGFKHDRMPVTSVGLEPCWQTHAYSSSYQWNREKFSEGFVESVRALGYELTLWCQLYIDPSSPLLPLLGKRFGDFEVWHGLVPDMADPKAREIYGDFLANQFIRQSVAGFKLDEVDGSPKTSEAYRNWMFPDFASFPSGADGDQVRNLLGRFGVQAINDAFRRQNRRTFGLVRADQAWSSPLSVAVYSDEYNFDDYVRYNLSAGVQGLLWSPEVRHADNERDWARRVAAAAFSAKMVYNDWQFPHPAWKQPNLSANEHGELLPDENRYIHIARRFSNLRMALLPYLYRAYGDYHRQGIAPVRPLVADWPEDGNTWHLEDQWMLGADLLVAPVTDANSFSSYTRQVVDSAKKFRSLNGSCHITNDGDTIELAMDFDGLGIKGAKTPLELQAGPCTMRFTYRADAGNAGIRLWTPDGKELREFHLDELPSGRGWQTGVVRATLPKAGTYSLYIGKAHASNGARRIAFRNITVIQKPQHQDAKTAWSREVYLPEGGWRDFWTGTAVAGGQWQVATAAPERPPVFVRDNTLLPLAEPLVTLNDKSVFTIHLATYGDNPRPCQLFEDDGTTFDYEKGKWATLTVNSAGEVQRPDHGQPQRYRIEGRAEDSAVLLERMVNSTAQNISRPDVAPVEPQIVVARVEKMPRVPQPLHIIDWKRIARDYYTVLFNPECEGVGLPAVNLAPDRVHFGFDGYLKPQRSRDPRGEAHACVIPVVGANMLGLDMAHLYDRNWIDPTIEWFDPLTKIWSNRPGSGRKVAHVIYEYWPLVIGTLLADQFPKHEPFNTALLQQAGTILQMAKDLGYPGHLNLDQDYQYRDGKWVVLPRRIDSNFGNAASFAWVLYAAYTKTNNPEYLAAAKEAIAWWLSTPGRYEMSHEMGPLVLARLNAEHGCAFDMQRMLDIWFGDYTAFSPSLPEGQVMPWGITAGTRLGGVTCDGLDGACWRKSDGFYAFAMGSYQAPGWLLPAVRYDQRLARAAARYALNAANSCRYFLGIDLDWEHQDHKDWRDSLPNGLGYLFSYEGVRSQPHASNAQHSPQPYATGDAVFGRFHRAKTPLDQYWTDKKEFSKSSDNIALYMGASIGFLGAPFNATDVDGVIAWDLNITDHFAPPSYRTRLLYNPFNATKTVTLNIGDTAADLYDTVTGGFLRKNVSGNQKISLAPDQAAVIVFAPVGGNISREGSRTLIDGVVVNWRTVTR